MCVLVNIFGGLLFVILSFGKSFEFCILFVQVVDILGVFVLVFMIYDYEFELIRVLDF